MTMAATNSGTPRGTVWPALRNTWTVRAHSRVSMRTPLIRPNHWWPATGNFAYAPTSRPLPIRPLSVR